MGRADLLVYRVTQDQKYAKAAEFLHQQLAAQPRNASGGYGAWPACAASLGLPR
jgi:unsaturated rhamnogalacturonyl hydrolase